MSGQFQPTRSHENSSHFSICFGGPFASSLGDATENLTQEGTALCLFSSIIQVIVLLSRPWLLSKSRSELSFSDIVASPAGQTQRLFSLSFNHSSSSSSIITGWKLGKLENCWPFQAFLIALLRALINRISSIIQVSMRMAPVNEQEKKAVSGLPICKINFANMETETDSRERD